MRKKSKLFAPYKKIIIVLMILFLVIIIKNKIAPEINKLLLANSPVVELIVENDHSYDQDQKIRVDDFEVTAVHENGRHSDVSSDDIELSTSKPLPYGDVTPVTITMKGNKKLSCDCNVKNERKKILGFQCGNPTAKDVIAVLYSNGELCFEGKGDVLQFDPKKFPWQRYEDEDDYPIVSITFEKGVTPKSMDHWFEGIETLAYVAPIPSSVESMSGTFSGCEGLTKAPDLGNCDSLLDLSNAFSGCVALVKAPAIPASVRNAAGMCSGCGELQNAPDMDQAINLIDTTGMFQDCKKLTSAEVPPRVEVMESMFEGCINLTDMPEIPDTAINMSNAFAGDISLSELTVIPKNVKDVSSCFYGCGKIAGLLWVDGEPEKYSGCFKDAAIATKVDLQGNSRMMHVLANTSQNNNITVDGKKPDAAMQSREDAIKK